jgi:hypothetical protein
VKIDVALQEAYDAEVDLASGLLRAGERHADEHDVFHLTRTLSAWCDEHVRRLADQGARYGMDLDGDAVARVRERGLLASAREKGAELVGRRPEAGLLLLRDLRDLHPVAARASLAWTVLGQGAQAIADTALLEVVTASHPQTIRTMKWTVQKIKDAGPQVLAG